MTQFLIRRCQYCGSENIGKGWKHGETLVTFKYHGLYGNRLKYLIFRNCGAVVYQCVVEPPPVSSSKILCCLYKALRQGPSFSALGAVCATKSVLEPQAAEIPIGRAARW